MRDAVVYVDPTPTQLELCDEFDRWCERQGVPRLPGDDPMLLNLLDRNQRGWLMNFIARWDWSTEVAAREIGALVTPLELAGVIVVVARENAARHEWRQILACELALDDLFQLQSVVDQAFARAQRLPLGTKGTPEREAAAQELKRRALAIVCRELAALAAGR